MACCHQESSTKGLQSSDPQLAPALLRPARRGCPERQPQAHRLAQIQPQQAPLGARWSAPSFGPIPESYLGLPVSSATIHWTRLLGRQGQVSGCLASHTCTHVCTRMHIHPYTTHTPMHTLTGAHNGTACPGLVPGRKQTWIFLEWINNHLASTCCEPAPGTEWEHEFPSVLHFVWACPCHQGGEATGRGSRGPTPLLAAQWPSRDQVA